VQGSIEDYPCRCSGGDFCYIVHHPKLSIPVSFREREDAEKELQRLQEADEDA
jgi:hypothetical protein